MQAVWNYTQLADSYIKRPNYSSAAIDMMCNLMDIGENSTVCDVGAGAGHLTIELGKRGMNVCAVEPNDAMRTHGIRRTKHLTNISWFEGTGENTQQETDQFDAIMFGSSFNVCDQAVALKEAFRISKSGGWFACMWNHRHLEDPIQKGIEEIIFTHLPNYNYGLRRQDQKPILAASNFFEKIEYVEGNVTHQQTIDECIEAWRSHGTLYREANENQALFSQILEDIKLFLTSLNKKEITIPYITRMWIAKFKRK